MELDTALAPAEGQTLEENQEPGWAEYAHTGADLSGCSAVEHDGFDLDRWVEATELYPRLAQAVETAATRLHTAPALLRDLFMHAIARYPRLVPPAPLTPAHYLNARIVQAVASSPDWEGLRTGTINDPLAAAMAVIAVAEQVITRIDQAVVDRANARLEYEARLARLDAQAAMASSAEDAARWAEQARLWREKQAQVRQGHQTGQGTKARAGVRPADPNAAADPADPNDPGDVGLPGMGQAAEQAGDEIDASQEMASALSCGDGAGGFNQGMPLVEKIRLAAKVAASPRLRRILDMTGRVARVAMEAQKGRIKDQEEELVDVTAGRDIPKILFSELALLASPEAEDLFHARYARGELAQGVLEAVDRQGRGPIILAIDSSGSMDGEPETWSKAVALAFCTIARRQRRDLAMIQFSGADNMLVEEFPYKNYSPDRLLSALDQFIGGGTTYEYWMRRALAFVDQSKYEKADVILISDGLAHVSDAMKADWDRRRKERKMRCTGVLIGDAGGDMEEGQAVLAGVCDSLATIADLTEDTDALKQLFAV